MLYLHTKTAFSSNNSIQRIIKGVHFETAIIERYHRRECSIK